MQYKAYDIFTHSSPCEGGFKGSYTVGKRSVDFGSSYTDKSQQLLEGKYDTEAAVHAAANVAARAFIDRKAGLV